MQGIGWKSLVVVGGLCLWLAGPTEGHEGHNHGASDSVTVTLTDGELMDRRGKPVRFQSEAIGNRIVVIDFVYSGCMTCPFISKAMAKVQDGLDERLGDKVLLISIGVDPETDTPEILNARAAELGAGPGWLWLTGNKSEVDRVLVGLDAYSQKVESRAVMVLVGDARSGEWTRFLGLPSAEQILDKVNELAAQRQ